MKRLAVTGMIILFCASSVGCSMKKGKETKEESKYICSYTPEGFQDMGLLDEEYEYIDIELERMEGEYYEDREYDESLSVYDRFYVDPRTAQLTFPEKKRNLIYLSVESLEKSLEAAVDGGGKATDVVPNLTALQKKYTNVQAVTGQQAFISDGGSWTMAGITCQTAGVPLMIVTNDFSFYNDAKFLEGACSIGEILEKQGYYNEYITGCPQIYAGTGLYFKQHGNYEIIDPDAAIKMGYLPAGYRAGWGYEDCKMFEILKSEITKASKQNKPFNIMASTLDTHSDDNFTCEKCDITIEDYHEREYRCLDSQVGEFVAWLEKQPFFENTTLVIAGDHISMSKIYFNDCHNDNIEGEYPRTVYTCFVNAVSNEKSYNKTYNTMDLFPTTLAAMGVKIKGERLGLGTNLFSRKQTLNEIYGKTRLNELLRQDYYSYYNVNLMPGGYWNALGNDIEELEKNGTTRPYVARRDPLFPTPSPNMQVKVKKIYE